MGEPRRDVRRVPSQGESIVTFGPTTTGDVYVNHAGIWWTGTDGTEYVAVGGPHVYRIKLAKDYGTGSGPVLRVDGEWLNRFLGKG